MGRYSKWTEDHIERKTKEGCGKGSLGNYKPWLTVQEVSSSGVSNRAASFKTDRAYQFLSKIEFDVFLALEWQEDVLDIREQYPLDRALTMTMAQKLGISHPFYPGTHVKTVMTVDFMVTRMIAGKRRSVAFNAKAKSDAEDPRELEKLEIQRACLTAMDCPHHLVFDTGIPEKVLENLAWINGSLHLKTEKESYLGYWQSLTQSMLTSLTGDIRTSKTLGTFCKEFGADLNVDKGVGIRVARMLMSKHILVPDLSAKEILDVPLMNFGFIAPNGTLRIVGGRK